MWKLYKKFPLFLDCKVSKFSMTNLDQECDDSVSEEKSRENYKSCRHFFPKAFFLQFSFCYNQDCMIRNCWKVNKERRLYDYIASHATPLQTIKKRRLFCNKSSTFLSYFQKPETLRYLTFVHKFKVTAHSIIPVLQYLLLRVSTCVI